MHMKTYVVDKLFMSLSCHFSARLALEYQVFYGGFNEYSFYLKWIHIKMQTIFFQYHIWFWKFNIDTWTEFVDQEEFIQVNDYFFNW